MTAMPELVAGFHSLVGLAAVFVAIAAFLNPEVFNLGSPGNIKVSKLNRNVYWSCSWSYYFFRIDNCLFKIKGIMSGAPITFSGQHYLNLTFRIRYFHFNILFV